MSFMPLVWISKSKFKTQEISEALNAEQIKPPSTGWIKNLNNNRNKLKVNSKTVSIYQ